MTSPVRRRRGIRLAGALALAAGFAVAPVAPAAACACGGVAPLPGSEVAVGEEHAIISWRDGVEQIDLLLAVLSSDSEAGLVFPTPSPATVSLGAREDFAAIDRVTTPRRVEEYDWWTFRGMGDGSTAGAPPEVLDVVQLGPIEATTLAASDTAGLETWLAEHDYELSPAVTELLGGYVDRGWFFVALKLTGDAPLDGGLDPLRFTFETDELVYPLELSRAATEPQTLRLFVFADHRQRVSFVGAGSPATSFTSWAAPVVGTEVESFGAYLTVLELFFSEPESQILGDLTFADTLTDDTAGTQYTVVVPVALLGIPLGWLVSGFVVVGIVGTLLVVTAVGAKRS
ncbi:DUF2330 domain-containing protein [Pseudolysinimonas sp.]|uniref:DUF2330 domain-containing protein n=1 Tax=Pseudolysinimonas sp. TaxID=2680009 RepID=UPI003783C204